jgi:hypothetical protein
MWLSTAKDIVVYGSHHPGNVAIAQELGWAFIVEGESDCWALWFNGLPAFGVPGAGQAGKLDPRDLNGIGKVFVVEEPDEAGSKFPISVAARIAEIAPEVRVFAVTMPAGVKDPSDLWIAHCDDGQEFHTRVAHARSEAMTRGRLEVPEAETPDHFDEEDYWIPLDVRSVTEWAQLVDEAGNPGWVARPVWPADAYGPIAAESKAGKTWAQLDLAVSKVVGGKWMGVYQCDPGPVTVFLGEGGERNTIRRLRAICHFYGVELEGLDDLRLCFRVPSLTDEDSLDALQTELAEYPTSLVILDPFYLAAAGSRGESLYGMAGPLQAAQKACQAVGAALVVVHHYNQTGSGKGARRMSGAGPEEWGRVIATADLVSPSLSEPGGISVVTLDWTFIGGEIAEHKVRVRRRVWTDDPNDLMSPMHYEIEVVDDADHDDPLDDLSPAARSVYWALERQDPHDWFDVGQVWDLVAEARESEGSKPLKRDTVRRMLPELRTAGLAEDKPGRMTNMSHEWRIRKE